MRVVDSHFHWYPEPHLKRMRRRIEYPRVEDKGDGYVYWYNNGRAYVPLSPVWFDLEAGLAAAAEVTGSETAVFCTTGVLTGLIDQASLSDSLDIATEYNEAIAEAQRLYSGRFYGSAYIPLQDTKEAVRLVDHAIEELNLYGINLPPSTGGGNIDAARLEPFYARVEELGIPLVVHPTDIVYGDTLEGYGGALQLTIGRLLDSSMTVLRLIFSGILDRHPDLKIMHTHAGGLLPYQAGRIDKNFRIESASTANLTNLPSQYMKRVFVDTVAPQALTIKTAIDFYGVQNVLYGTDYPCWSPRAAREVVCEASSDSEQRARIFSENAEAVLNLA